MTPGYLTTEEKPTIEKKIPRKNPREIFFSSYFLWDFKYLHASLFVH